MIDLSKRLHNKYRSVCNVLTITFHDPINLRVYPGSILIDVPYSITGFYFDQFTGNKIDRIYTGVEGITIDMTVEGLNIV